MEEYRIIFTHEFNGDISYQYLKTLTSLIDDYNTNDINWEWTRDKEGAMSFTKEKSFDILDNVRKHYPQFSEYVSMKKKKERILRFIPFEKTFGFLEL